MLTIKRVTWIMLALSCGLLAQPVSAEQENEFQSNGKYIRLQTASEDLFTVYLVGSEQAKQGILLIHEWWGLNKEIEAWADQFAADGYRVMAVDLFNCNVTTYPARARKLMSSVNQAEANEKYAATLKALSAEGRKIAVVGRSYGASQAFHAASIAQQKVSATVIYYPYGELMTDKNKLSAIKAPILAHFARDDFFLTPDKIAQFTSSIQKSDLKMIVNLYDAKHGFDKATGKNFNKAAHMLALSRTQRFLDKYMQ